jgi:hypothetical protein
MLPPHSFGEHRHVVLVDRADGGCWVAMIDGRPLGPTFRSESEARGAAATEELRLDGIAHALLRRVRRNLRRKQ